MLVRNTARDDKIEMLHVRIDVERETVIGDPLFDARADLRDLDLLQTRIGLLGLIDPDADQLINQMSGDAKIGERADQRSFERAHIPTHIAPKIFQIQNGIADKLARTMEGDIASAVRFINFGAHALQSIWRKQNIRPVGIATKRVNRWMLQQEECIGGVPSLARRHAFMLQAQAFSITDNAR